MAKKHYGEEEEQHLPPDDDPVEEHPSDTADAPAEGVRREGPPPGPPTGAQCP